MKLSNLKFRAWHKGLNKWCEPRIFSMEDLMNIPFSSVGLSIYDGGHCLSVESKDVELMQWTGYADEDGLDIYVGDIVKYYPYLSKQWRDNPEAVVVESLESFYSDLHNIVILDRSKVIGNIHENPELLKKTPSEEND